MGIPPLDHWNKWAPQFLVLLSLTLQVVLLVLAPIRRREGSPVILRIILWLAYQLADLTAVYAVGHLSLSSTLKQHQLVAFWAPFLLLHLGGPDNITAYALQDNQLWLRHLITLIVQVLGAAYVVYKHIIGKETLLMVATFLMFAVGLVKYGERTWALRCGNMYSIRTSLKKEPRAKCHFYLAEPPREGFKSEGCKLEFLVQRAHSLFHICKSAIADFSVDVESYGLDAEILHDLDKEQWDAVIEMELSLMYDILYTKAVVIHTESGYVIRFISPVAIATSFVLFYLSNKTGDSGIDVLISYILLGAAFFMEMISLLGALGSSWTLVFLCATRWSWLRHFVLCSGTWARLRGAVACFHRLGKIINSTRGRGLSRTWPGAMGQYNMLHVCTRPDTSKGPLLGRLANWIGHIEWWDRKHYSGKIIVPKTVNKLVGGYIFTIFRNRGLNTLGVIRNSWGERTLKKLQLEERLNWTLGVELQEGIIIWHIGTDIFLARSTQAKAQDAAESVEVITTVSNYMMFLLVERPEMLPGLAQNRLYQQTCLNLENIWSETGGTSVNNLKKLFSLHDDPKRSRLKERQELATSLLSGQDRPTGPEFPRLNYSIAVAKILLNAEDDKDGDVDPLEVLLELWTDILVYAANRSSRESLAKKLNSGGELTTFFGL